MNQVKTKINYFNEASYYMAQQILLELLLVGKITEEEYIVGATKTDVMLLLVGKITEEEYVKIDLSNSLTSPIIVRFFDR